MERASFDARENHEDRVRRFLQKARVKVDRRGNLRTFTKREEWER